MVSLFLLWERYLEQVIDTSRAPSPWTSPPLIKLSLRTRAKGWMAIIVVITFLNVLSLASASVFRYIHVPPPGGTRTLTTLRSSCTIRTTFHSPMQSMSRSIPMFIVGWLCNVFAAIFVCKLPLIIFAAMDTWWHAVTIPSLHPLLNRTLVPGSQFNIGVIVFYREHSILLTLLSSFFCPYPSY
ncbi:hypothetical protein BDR07DRAFT_589129 [Suillus spraguei]|nr:hypothetical protein BDR07DRAFT_589129 [Suillus spraguei]